jgi:hypothetical protein
MTTRLEVQSYQTHNESIQFKCDNDQLPSQLELEASGQVLVDSDTRSFIYILDSSEGFVYVSFQKEHWNALKEVIEHDKEVKLELSGHPILTLVGFKSELEYLIENIKGNSNYGEEMMKSVESVFLTEEQLNN